MTRPADPAVAAIAGDLRATLGRMGQKIETLDPQDYPPALKVQVPATLAREVEQWMARRGLRNRAEALRRLIAAGLQAR